MTISGNTGNGKNTLGVAILRVCSKKCIHNVKLEFECVLCEKYEISQHDRKIRAFANYPISLPEVECNYMDTYLDFLKIRPSKKHAVCIIDEPNAWGFDSAKRTTESLAIGRKIQQTRHYNMDIIFLTQLWSMVDLRGKRLSKDTVLAVEPEPKGFQYGIFKFDDIIPLSIPKSYAKSKLYPYFDTAKIIGENEDDIEPEDNNSVTFGN